MGRESAIASMRTIRTALRGGAMTRPKYRARTWIRIHLPHVLSDRIPKGRYDCGAHDWYNADDVVERCYHCVVGVRPRRESETTGDD